MILDIALVLHALTKREREREGKEIRTHWYVFVSVLSLLVFSQGRICPSLQLNIQSNHLVQTSYHILDS